MIESGPSESDVWPVELRSVHLARSGWTLWGTAPVGDGHWFLARLGQILLFTSKADLADFVSRDPIDHSLVSLLDWKTHAEQRLAGPAEAAPDFDFEEDGSWLLDIPASWPVSRRSDMLDRLNLLWDAANQFDDKTRVGELLGGGRGSLLGRLADALMEEDECALSQLSPFEVQRAYRSQTGALFSRCLWA